MELEDALTTYLLAQTGLTDLISDRIYPSEAPEGEQMPYVVFFYVSDVKGHCYGHKSDLESPNVQYTTYASTLSGARAVANQIKTALGDYAGDIGVPVQYIKLLNELPGKIEISGTMVDVIDQEYQINFTKE